MFKSGIWTTTTTTKKKTKKRKSKENTTHNSKNFIRINIDVFTLHGSIKEGICIHVSKEPSTSHAKTTTMQYTIWKRCWSRRNKTLINSSSFQYWKHLSSEESMHLFVALAGIHCQIIGVLIHPNYSLFPHTKWIISWACQYVVKF